MTIVDELGTFAIDHVLGREGEGLVIATLVLTSFVHSLHIFPPP